MSPHPRIFASTHLRAYKALHLSRTLYKSALFMQNKPNLLDAQMNVNSILTKDYERNGIFAFPENKANSNPIFFLPKSPGFSLPPHQVPLRFSLANYPIFAVFSQFHPRQLVSFQHILSFFEVYHKISFASPAGLPIAIFHQNYSSFANKLLPII